MEYGKRILKFLKNLLNQRFYFKNYLVKNQIIIFDDMMPSNLSPWRAIEFEGLCRNFDKVKVFTDLISFKNYSKGLSFKKNLQILKNNYPKLSHNIKTLHFFNNINSRLIYFLFFNNAYLYYKIAEKNKIDFAFTLYPGGGFLLNHEGTDEKLNEIFKSKYFKGVIVNQFHVKDYLIKKNLCETDKIHLVFGLPININEENLTKYYPPNKFEEDLNIVFFANKYIAKGQDKGFDVFQNTASLLLKRTKKIKFHVIGNFDVKDLDDFSNLDFFTFYGVLTEKEYVDVLKKTNIILCPNRPYILHPNSFDGFPLATCVEASQYDNLIMATDFFYESSQINLLDNQDFMLINTNPAEIAEKIINLENNRNLLKKIAQSGKQKIIEIYSIEQQIHQRTMLFNELLS